MNINPNRPVRQRALPRACVYWPQGATRSYLGGIFDPSTESIERFESKLASYIGVDFAVATPSGTSALLLGLKLMNFPPNAEVIMPSYMVPEVADAVVGTQLVPSFADIDPQSYNICPTSVAQCITPETKCLLVPHLYGKASNMPALIDLATKHKLTVIEDIAQSLGGRHGNTRLGTFGAFSTISFGPMKTLNTAGGGALLTNDADMAARAKTAMQRLPKPSSVFLARRCGAAVVSRTLSSRSVFGALTFPAIRTIAALSDDLLYEQLRSRDDSKMGTGYTARAQRKQFTAAQAAAGEVGLLHVDSDNQIRQHNGNLLSQRLTSERIPCPKAERDEQHVFTNFVISTPNRHALARALQHHGIDTTHGYIPSLSRMPQFNKWRRSCPNSDALEENNLYLPVHPLLTEEEIHYIANTIIEISSSNPELRPTAVRPLVNPQTFG